MIVDKISTLPGVHAFDVSEISLKKRLNLPVKLHPIARTFEEVSISIVDFSKMVREAES